jgi:hypothetical protein
MKFAYADPPYLGLALTNLLEGAANQYRCAINIVPQDK